MAFKARVYLHRSGKTEATYLGEIDLDVRPIQYGRISFMHDGKIVVGHIEIVTPANWAETGGVPTVYVVQREHG